MRNINAKIIELFKKLELLKTRGVTSWAKKIRLVIVYVRIWHQLQNSANLIEFYNWCYILTITDLIFSAQNVIPLFFRSPSSSNNSIILALLFLKLW